MKSDDVDSARKGTIEAIKDDLFIREVPSYGNKIFYSLGFLGLTCFAMLAMTGLVMVFFGPNWWLLASAGVFFRSVHLWAAQAFVLVILLHALVVFLTSAFKHPRRLTWVLGSIVFFLMLTEAEFGYDLRGDFSAQYRALQGADFWNGAYLGRFINTLNYGEVYGIHVIYIPIIILVLLSFHYLLVKLRGIAKPYRKDAPYKMVAADHRKLFTRGFILATAIIALAVIFPSPFVEPATVKSIAVDDPGLAAQTFMSEFTRTSDTATYMDSIDPYVFDTRDVFVAKPYEKLVSSSGIADYLAQFRFESADKQNQDASQAEDYFKNNGKIDTASNLNPLIPVVSSLVGMAKSGFYQGALDAENPGINPTYSLRFLADTDVLDSEAEDLHITTEQYGMMREETGKIPPGAWWLAPIGFLNHTVLANDDNGDRDGAEIVGILALLFVSFPYIPLLNRLPEKLPLARLIWKTKE